ncbi:MAG: hypothetical protein IT275_02205 [Chitinophagales bacterium]|nr:hypothetical protein [Chitinophagales bacterium]
MRKTIQKLFQWKIADKLAFLTKFERNFSLIKCNFVEDNEHEIPKRGTQKKFRRSDKDALRTYIAHRLQQGIETAKEEFERRQILFSHHEQEDLEMRIIFDIAKDESIWIDDLYLLGKPTLVGGHENTLALDDTTGFLYKSNNLFNAKFLVSNLLKQINLHNELFPETYCELVGFTGFDNGKCHAPYIEVIYKQQYVDNAIQATPIEIRDFMLAIGFKQIDETRYTNDVIIVADLYPRNVLKDMHGYIYVVDDIVTLV